MNASLTIGSFPSHYASATNSISFSANNPFNQSFATYYAIISYTTITVLAFMRPFSKRLSTRRQPVTITSARGPVDDVVRSLPSLGAPNAGFEPVWWLPG
jgi:hypothetical protein